MSYLTQSLRNAYDSRDRSELERLLAKVEALEKQGGVVPVGRTPGDGLGDPGRQPGGAGSISAAATVSTAIPTDRCRRPD